MNTASGYQSLYSNTTGNWNTAKGNEALYANTSGSENTATGNRSLRNNTSGAFNTSAGSWALRFNTTGYYNTAFGALALRDNTTQNYNTALGYHAGADITSSSGTFIGGFARATASGYSNVTGIGYNARPDGNNTIHLGNTNVAHIKGQVMFSTFSEGNYKSNIREDVAGLDFVLRLRPVSYHVDAHKLAADVGEDEIIDEEGSKKMIVTDENTLKSRDEKSAIREVGFVAQEVEALVNEMGVAFNGVDVPQNDTGKYGLRYASFVVPLVKAVNEILLQENGLIKQQLAEVLDLLKQQGFEPGSVNTNDPSRAGSDRSFNNMGTNTARLEQNTPNPFRENTLIRYFLPQDTRSASIIVTDINGMQLMSFTLNEPGSGQVIINGGSLNAGTYIYTLLINGQRVDAKRMVLVS